MKYLGILLLLLSCHVRIESPRLPEEFWCVSRYTECIGESCPFYNYYSIGNNDCHRSSATCEVSRQAWMNSKQQQQGYDNWYYDASCYHRNWVYCYRGPLPGDAEYCWDSYYSCEHERYDDMFQCYKVSR